MGFKLKKDGIKETVTVRDEIQAAAFIKAGFVPANKTEEERLYGTSTEDAPVDNTDLN